MAKQKKFDYLQRTARIAALAEVFGFVFEELSDGVEGGWIRIPPPLPPGLRVGATDVELEQWRLRTLYLLGPYAQCLVNRGIGITQ